MPSDTKIRAHHAAQAVAAKVVYLASKTPLLDMADWHSALRQARQMIADTLRASNHLASIQAALQVSGAHTLVLRHIMAPPISQDQFTLVCDSWRKSTEKSGPPLTATEASEVAFEFDRRRSRALTPWLDLGRPVQMLDIRRLLWSVAPLIASQQLQTVQRNRASARQERSVISLLDGKGWTRQQGSLLDTRAALPLKHYMHKIRYATGSGTPQEVDLALGLQGTIVLAMECKVSNDETNSVKRVNDVLKKSSAWKTHWGNFVKTAALLQGVIAPKDVWRLLDEGVEVFWSHDLSEFEAWIDIQVTPSLLPPGRPARLGRGSTSPSGLLPNPP